MTEVAESLKNVMCFSPRDWSLDRDDAWMYGVVVGWGSAVREVAEAHRWDGATIERLKRLHREFARMASKAGGRGRKKETE